MYQVSNRVAQVIEPEVLTEILESIPEKKVGILGGTFNPPHVGHLIIADQVKDQLGLEKVLFIPTAIPPHKNKKETLSASHRQAMLEMSIQDNASFEIDTTELNRGGKSYTFETIKALKERNPDTEFYFIIGADMVKDLPNWYKIEELIHEVQFVAVNRPTYDLSTNFPVIMVDVPDIVISSSLIRQKVKDDCTIKYLVTPETHEYIESEGLYKNGKKQS